MKSIRLLISYLTLSLASFTAVGLQASGTDTPVDTTEYLATGTATVKDIDINSRQVTLNAHGRSVTITAGPEVRNFERIKVGDIIMVEYYEGLAVALLPKVEGTPQRQDEIVVQRAEKGEKPAMAVGGTVRAEGVVEAIDREHRVVTLRGPLRTVHLKVGDDVDLSALRVGEAALATVITGYAISVLPPDDVDAEVRIQSKSVSLLFGFEWGGGTVTLRDGTRRNLKVSGLSVGGLGVSKVDATGYVYNLKAIEDFSGTYYGREVGLTLVQGGSETVLKNDKGVLIRLTTAEAGLKFKVAGSGMKLELAD